MCKWSLKFWYLINYCIFAITMSRDAFTKPNSNIPKRLLYLLLLYFYKIFIFFLIFYPQLACKMNHLLIISLLKLLIMFNILFKFWIILAVLAILFIFYLTTLKINFWTFLAQVYQINLCWIYSPSKILEYLKGGEACVPPLWSILKLLKNLRGCNMHFTP